MCAVDILERTTKLTTDDHCETGLLWRTDDVQTTTGKQK